MGDLLNEFLAKLLSEAKTKSKAAVEAERLGLEKKPGFGLYGPPDGDATHRVQTKGRDKGKLIPITQQKPKGTGKDSVGRIGQYVDPRASKPTLRTPLKPPPTTDRGQSSRQQRIRNHPANVAGKGAVKQLQDDSEELFGYAGSRSAGHRARNLARLSVLAEDDRLTPEQQKAAIGIEADLKVALKLYTRLQSGELGKRERAKLQRELEEHCRGMQERYKFFSNSSGTSFKSVSVGQRQRHVLGQGSGLSKDMVKIFGEVGIDLSKAQQGDKKIKNDLSRVSKVKMGDPVTGYAVRGKKRGEPSTPAAPRVEALFSDLDFIEETDRAVFGPTVEGPPRDVVDNTRGKNAQIYFRHSMQHDSSLSDAATVLEQNDYPEMAQNIRDHQTRMKKLSDNWGRSPYDTPEKREAYVQKSYTDMALALHKPPTGDADLCGSIMKNIAEKALYDAEIAGGKEAYLPAGGSFPGADKIVVTRKGTKVERIDGISVKYGKSGKFYGMPAQSNTIGLFHPDKAYHSLTSGRPGMPGYGTGISERALERPLFMKLVSQSGFGKILGKDSAERLRTQGEKFSQTVQTEFGKCIKKRGGRAKNECAGEAYRHAQKKHHRELHAELFGKPPNEKRRRQLVETFGQDNIRMMENHPESFYSFMAMDATIQSGGGLTRLQHCHQSIDEKAGFSQKIEQGSTRRECWHFQWRPADQRAGGLLMGYSCPEPTKGSNKE